MGVTDFLDFMTETVTIEPFASRNAYNEATYGTAQSITARVVGKVKMVRDSKGEERVSTKTVYLATADMFDPEDRLTLPVGSVPLTPPILAVSSFPDEIGAHHTVLFV